MPSFDIVSEVDKQEVRNAVDQTNKEITGRYDFKDSDAKVEQSDYDLTAFADSDFQLEQVIDILRLKLSKRQIDVRCLEVAPTEKISGNKVKTKVTVKVGIPSDLGKKINKFIKDSKMKVQPSIQGDAVRVSGAKRDVLQECIQLVKSAEFIEIPLQFINFRD